MKFLCQAFFVAICLLSVSLADSSLQKKGPRRKGSKKNGSKRNGSQKGQGKKERQDIVLDGTTDAIGRSTLIRTRNKLKVNLKINTLGKGVWTMWIVAFGQEAGIFIGSAGYLVLKKGLKKKKGSVKLKSSMSRIGDASIECDQSPYSDLTNLDGKVTIKIAEHGVPDDFDKIPEGWLTNFWDGHEETSTCGGQCHNVSKWCATPYVSTYEAVVLD